MNAEALLGLLSDLYAQIVALQQRVRELEQQVSPDANAR
jgi:hypothetical protein